MTKAQATKSAPKSKLSPSETKDKSLKADTAAVGASKAASVAPTAPTAPTAATGASAKKGQQKRPARARPATGGKAAKGRGQSGLDAAARVLKESGKPLNARAITDAMMKKGYWKSGGKTPWATIAAAMMREIAGKGKAVRFKKAARGLFTAK